MKNIQLKQNGRFFFGWYIVLLGFLLMTFAYVGFVSLTSVFVLPVTEDLGFERGDFMTYLVILSLACVIASPFLGRLMGKGNIKLYLAVACLLGFIGYFGFSRATSLTHFYLIAALLGIGFAGTAPMPVSILINSWFGGKIRGTATGIAFIGSGVGGMILSPILNGVITAYGWRTGYIVLGLVFLVILLPCVLLLANKDPQSKGFTRMGETAEESQTATLEKPGMTLKEAKSTGMFWMAVVSVVLVILASSALLANSVSYFVQCGISPGRAASLHGFMLGAMIIGKPLCGMFTDKAGIKAGAFLSCILFACTFAVLYIMPAAAPVLVFGVIACYGLGAPTITVIPPLMVNGLFGEKDYGTIVGIMNMATSIGGAFGGTIAAKIYDATGSYSAFWLIAIVSVLLAAILRFLCFKGNTQSRTALTE